MAEPIVADFTTRLIPDAARYQEPVRGRVLMSDRRVVLATDTERVTIPINRVFDIAYGQAPSDLAEFFDDTVTIGYRSGRSQQLAVLSGASDVVDRFTMLLFKGVLNGAKALIKYPAKVGGRVTATTPIETRLRLGGDTVAFIGSAGSSDDSGNSGNSRSKRITLDVATVIHFERRTWTVGGESRPSIAIRHVEATGEVLTTEIALASERRMNVLGRHLRHSYARLATDLDDLSMTDEEIELLVTCYTDNDASLVRVLGTDASHVTMLQNGLVEKGLLTSDGPRLTRLGRLAVGQHIEAVNR